VEEGLNVDLFGNPKPAEQAEPSPRGLLDDGLVRTTGWLQFGTRGVRSEVVCALIFLLHGLVIAVALVVSNPVLAGITVLAAAPCGCVLWRLTTVLLRPASRARNTHTIEARHLAPADWVRLHGSIGPVGRVGSVTTPDGGQELNVRFAGGTRKDWPADHEVH
jgi:hypothetical protein